MPAWSHRFICSMAGKQLPTRKQVNLPTASAQAEAKLPISPVAPVVLPEPFVLTALDAYKCSSENCSPDFRAKVFEEQIAVADQRIRAELMLEARQQRIQEITFSSEEQDEMRQAAKQAAQHLTGKRHFDKEMAGFGQTHIGGYKQSQEYKDFLALRREKRNIKGTSEFKQVLTEEVEKDREEQKAKFRQIFG